MSKPIHTVQVERLSHECRGIGKIDEKTTFIRGALPGEEVNCQIVKKHRQYLDACTTDVITAAPERTEPKCPHFLTCGGCSLQHILPEAQISFKQNILLEQLEHIGKTKPETILDPITGPHYAYRHKARLGARYVIKKEKMLVGFREVQGRYLADIDQCDILHPSVGYKLRDLADLIMKLTIPREIPQIEVAIGDTETALIFRHLEALTDEDLAFITAFGKEHNFQIYLQPGKPKTIHKIFPNDGNERLHYALPDFNLEFKFYPCDFTQVNPEINRKMVTRAIELLDVQKTDNVLDLFCGLGNFTLPIATKAKSVVGVEGSEEMVSRGKENALHNNINNASFYAQDLSADAFDSAWFDQPYDKLLIDPPRSGAQEIICALAPLRIPLIVYISCNPATLARDTEILTSQFGYKLKSAGILDMFPQTAHVESMAVFELV